MPGTIQVSVIEFNGVSSSQSSAKSVKVSMGKTHYHTYDKGDFFFPLTKLREDLVVALLDAAGNEMAHADIRAMQIIEKGNWDAVFSLNGAAANGSVHLKLRVVLSEDDRKRVKVMRESAIKKKREIHPTINLRYLKTAGDAAETSSYGVQISVSDSQIRFSATDVVSPKIETSHMLESSSSSSYLETSPYSIQVSDSKKRFAEEDVAIPDVEALRADLSLDSTTFSVDSLSSYQKEEHSIRSCSIPNVTDTSQGDSSSPVNYEVNQETCQVNERDQHEKIADVRSDVAEGDLPVLSRPSISNKTDLVAPMFRADPIESQNQGPQKKTPSSVRKMISAFESSQFQDFKKGVKFLKKSSSVPSQLNRTGKGELLDVRNSKADVQSAESPAYRNADIVSNNTELSHVPKELESRSESIPSIEKASDSEEMSNVAPGTTIIEEREISPIVLMKESGLETPSGSGRLDGELCQGVQNDNSSAENVSSSDPLDTGRKLTTSDLGTMENELCRRAQTNSLSTNSVNSTDSVAETMEMDSMSFNEETNISSNPEMCKDETQAAETEMANNKHIAVNMPELGSDSPPEDPSHGLVGLVIKIVAVLGFGVLVLLNRKKEPRKKITSKNVEIFRVSDYNFTEE